MEYERDEDGAYEDIDGNRIRARDVAAAEGKMLLELVTDDDGLDSWAVLTSETGGVIANTGRGASGLEFKGGMVHLSVAVPLTDVIVISRDATEDDSRAVP